MKPSTPTMDELVLHLLIRRSNAKEGSDEYNAAHAALRKLIAQYPDAQHLAEDHVSNIPAGYD